MVQDLKTRTKKFAIDCGRLCRNFPHSREYNAYVNQLIRSSSSVGANYRASQRGKSTADFINKLKIVEEEADESHFFLEILLDLYDLDDVVRELLKDFQIDKVIILHFSKDMNIVSNSYSKIIDISHYSIKNFLDEFINENIYQYFIMI